MLQQINMAESSDSTQSSEPNNDECGCVDVTFETVCNQSEFKILIT